MPALRLLVRHSRTEEPKVRSSAADWPFIFCCCAQLEGPIRRRSLLLGGLKLFRLSCRLFLTTSSALAICIKLASSPVSQSTGFMTALPRTLFSSTLRDAHFASILRFQTIYKPASANSVSSRIVSDRLSMFHSVAFGNTITTATGLRPPARVVQRLDDFLIAGLKQTSWHDLALTVSPFMFHNRAGGFTSAAKPPCWMFAMSPPGA
jgi:hypothetical protein